MKLLASWLAVALVACTSHVKQAHAPGAEEFQEGGEDLAAAPEKGPKPVIKDTAQLKHECCAQCTAALASDKTGDDPAKIPCADFTAGLKEECLDFFRKTPMMAADAKTCAAEAPAAAKPKGDEDAQ